MYIIGEEEDEPRFEAMLLTDEHGEESGEWIVVDNDDNGFGTVCTCANQEVAEFVVRALDLFMRASYAANREIAGL